MLPLPFEVFQVPAEEIDARVLPLWREGMSDQRIAHTVERRRDWLYRLREAGATCSWAVRDNATGDVIGACSVVPRLLTIGGRTYRAGLLSDFIVRADARAAGPAIALQRDLASQSRDLGFDFLFGSPNRKAWPIFARLGYKAVTGTRCWVKPLRRDPGRVQKLLRLLVGERASAAPGAAFARLLAPPIAFSIQAGLRACEAAAAGWFALGGYRATLREMSAAPLGFDGRQEQRPTIVTHDEPGYLAWRYADHPTNRYLLFEVMRAGRVVAWAIVRGRGEAAEVQDAAWVDDEPSAPRALWWLLPRQLRLTGCSVVTISCAGAGDVDASLRASLYVERPEDRKLIVYLAADSDPKLKEALASERSWRLFAGELDI